MTSTVPTQPGGGSAPAALPPRRVTCRYLRRNDQQCTGEAVDADHDVPLCQKHLGRVLEALRDALGLRR